jgi:vesicle-associated membrane protein 7
MQNSLILTIQSKIMFKSSYLFHYINEDNFTYLCMTDATFPKRVSFVYLDDIKQRFLEKYSLE